MQLNRLFGAALFLPLIFSSPGFAGHKTPYEYFRVGNSADLPRTQSQGGTVLMGGGTDVDAAFQWMCGRIGKGDFLVIRATGTDAYNPYIQQLCPAVNSVATLIIPTKTAANDPFVASTISNAEAIWIAGGDQSDYINDWTGTPVQLALNTAIQNKVPIGGTSAGLNVLTQFVYSALQAQGVTSSQALANPYSKYITLARDFVDIPQLTMMIGDAHFIARDRMGRELAFLCRIYPWTTSMHPRSVAVDAETALEIEPNGNVTVVGNSKAYFLQAPGAPETCTAGVPLTYKNVGVYRIDHAGTFNISTWVGAQGSGYTVSAISGVLSSDQPGNAIY